MYINRNVRDIYRSFISYIFSYIRSQNVFIF